MNFYEKKKKMKAEAEEKAKIKNELEFQEEQAKIRLNPHKIVNGICVALSSDELEEVEKRNLDGAFFVFKNKLLGVRYDFLSRTDYIAIKNLEKGISDYPEKDIRQKAREEINEINEIETLDELQKFDYILA